MTKNRRRKQDIREQMESSGSPYLQAAREIGAEASLFIPTGLPTLDSRLYGGVPIGGLTTLIGSPGSGKSVFLRELLSKAIELKKRVAVITDRANALELSGLVHNSVLTGYNYFHPVLLEDTLNGIDDPHSLDLIVVDGPAFESRIAADRTAELRSALRELARSLGAALVMTSTESLRSYSSIDGNAQDGLLEIGYGPSYGSVKSRAIYPRSSQTWRESPVIVQLSSEEKFKEVKLSASGSRLKRLSTREESVALGSVSGSKDGNSLLRELAEAIVSGQIELWNVPYKSTVRSQAKSPNGDPMPLDEPSKIVRQLEYLIENERFHTFYSTAFGVNGEYPTLQNSSELRIMLDEWLRGDDILPRNPRSTHLESLLAFHRDDIGSEKLLEDFLVQYHVRLGDREHQSDIGLGHVYAHNSEVEISTVEDYAKSGYVSQKFADRFRDRALRLDASLIELSAEDRVFFLPSSLDPMAARIALRVHSARRDGTIQRAMLDGLALNLVARRDWFWSEDLDTGSQELYRLDQDRELFSRESEGLMDGVLILA